MIYSGLLKIILMRDSCAGCHASERDTGTMAYLKLLLAKSHLISLPSRLWFNPM